MKIIFNTYPVAFQCPGGGEIQLLKSMEALVRAGVETIRFDPWTTRLDDADVVHYFSVQGGSLNFCNYVHEKGIPLVISPIIWLGKEPEIYPVHEIGLLLEIADVICPNSVAESTQLCEYFDLPRDKFCVTHNGVDDIFLDRIDGSLFREKFAINSRFALCVGNIERRKNQLKLVRAMREIDLNLVLIGNVRDTSYYNECMQQGEGFVTHIDYIDHHDPLLRSAFSACEVFTLPSMLETPGLAALEAIASGAKVVVTEIGSTREYFGNRVTYVSPGSHSSIRDGILESLESASHEPVCINDYSWDRTADELAVAYRMATGA